ncbi:hypothetical protein KKE26_01140 [bacterium]|nr:hypothetical protein [bacterium]MBU1753321.1 hypothetical protein [bacterium]
MNTNGTIITLIGISLFLVSIFASKGYEQGRSIMGNMYRMEVVISEGKVVVYDTTPDTTPKKGQTNLDEAFEAFREYNQYHSSSIVGRYSIPLSFLLSLSTIITLVGIGKIILSKKQK